MPLPSLHVVIDCDSGFCENHDMESWAINLGMVIVILSTDVGHAIFTTSFVQQLHDLITFLLPWMSSVSDGEMWNWVMAYSSQLACSRTKICTFCMPILFLICTSNFKGYWCKQLLQWWIQEQGTMTAVKMYWEFLVSLCFFNKCLKAFPAQHQANCEGLRV